MDPYRIGVYWGARREDVDECARRTEFFFALLARYDPSLGRWYRSGQVTRRSPRPEVRTNDPENIKEHLLRGRSRGDLTGAVLEHMGFSLSVWNQEPDERSTRIRLWCGGYSPFANNGCLLEPASEGADSERMQQPEMLEQLLTCMATAWEPDWGTLTTPSFREALRKEEGEAHMGWMMYFSRQRGIVPPLPAPVRIEPVGSLGTLVILCPECMDASNPDHLALGQRVRELLDRAGLIKRRAP